MKPNFLVIGAARSGTTSLFQYLDPHPQIYMSQVKELNFFSNERFWNKGFGWYENRFDRAPPTRKAIGEASTSYTKAPFTNDVVQRIHDYQPDMKLIYIVRDPIERYISHYMQRVQVGLETRSFAQTLDVMENEAFAWQGRYAYQLQQYLRLFAEEQLLIRSMDQIRTDAAGVVRDIYRFLGVDDSFTIQGLEKIHNANTRVVRKTAAGMRILGLYRRYMEHREIPYTLKKLVLAASDLGGDLVSKPVPTPEQRQKLIRFYQDDTRELQERFGVNTEGWLSD